LICSDHCLIEFSTLVGLVISAIAIVVTLCIGLVSLHLVRKQHRINGLQDAFKILNTVEHRNFRDRVYQMYHDYKETNNIQIFRNKEPETVRADFDVIGILVEHKNIDKKLFLIEFGPLVYKCWICLEASIEDERQRRKFKPFMKHFQCLAEEARKFWADEGEDLSKLEIYDTRQKT
jgi:hypothetical protein